MSGHTSSRFPAIFVSLLGWLLAGVLTGLLLFGCEDDKDPVPAPRPTVTVTVIPKPSPTPTRPTSGPTPTTAPTSAPSSEPPTARPEAARTRAPLAKTRAPEVKRTTRPPTNTSRSTTRPVIGSPRAYARSVLSASQFSCLDALFTRESGWNVYATNPTSGAYGIPQALPGSKMATAGSDWRTNGVTQVKWGLQYVKGRYGSACGAWSHFQAHNWY